MENSSGCLDSDGKQNNISQANGYPMNRECPINKIKEIIDTNEFPDSIAFHHSNSTFNVSNSSLVPSTLGEAERELDVKSKVKRKHPISTAANVSNDTNETVEDIFDSTNESDLNDTITYKVNRKRPISTALINSNVTNETVEDIFDVKNESNLNDNITYKVNRKRPISTALINSNVTNETVEDIFDVKNESNLNDTITYKVNRKRPISSATTVSNDTNETVEDIFTNESNLSESITCKVERKWPKSNAAIISNDRNETVEGIFDSSNESNLNDTIAYKVNRKRPISTATIIDSNDTNETVVDIFNTNNESNLNDTITHIVNRKRPISSVTTISNDTNETVDDIFDPMNESNLNEAVNYKVQRKWSKSIVGIISNDTNETVEDIFDPTNESNLNESIAFRVEQKSPKSNAEIIDNSNEFVGEKFDTTNGSDLNNTNSKGLERQRNCPISSAKDIEMTTTDSSSDNLFDSMNNNNSSLNDTESRLNEKFDAKRKRLINSAAENIENDATDSLDVFDLNGTNELSGIGKRKRPISSTDDVSSLNDVKNVYFFDFNESSLNETEFRVKRNRPFPKDTTYSSNNADLTINVFDSTIIGESSKNISSNCENLAKHDMLNSNSENGSIEDDISHDDQTVSSCMQIINEISSIIPQTDNGTSSNISPNCNTLLLDAESHLDIKNLSINDYSTKHTMESDMSKSMCNAEAAVTYLDDENSLSHSERTLRSTSDILKSISDVRQNNNSKPDMKSSSVVDDDTKSVSGMNETPNRLGDCSVYGSPFVGFSPLDNDPLNTIDGKVDYEVFSSNNSMPQKIDDQGASTSSNNSAFAEREAIITRSQLCKTKIINDESDSTSSSDEEEAVLNKTDAELYKYNNKSYKNPIFPKFSEWCTKPLYNHIIEKIEPKYGIATNRRAVEIVQYLSEEVNFAIKEFMKDNKKMTFKQHVNNIKLMLFEQGIIQTPWEFYRFSSRFMPVRFRTISCPTINNPYVHYDRETIFLPIDYKKTQKKKK